MLHLVPSHLHLVRPHQQLQVVLLQEALRHVLSEHRSRLSARRLPARAVHGVRPQQVLQQAVHAVREPVDLVDVLQRHAVLLEQPAVQDQRVVLQHRRQRQCAEALGKQLQDVGVVLRLHLALEAEHLVDLRVRRFRRAHRRLVVAAQQEEAVRLRQLVAERRQRDLHGEAAAVREVACV